MSSLCLLFRAAGGSEAVWRVAQQAGIRLVRGRILEKFSPKAYNKPDVPELKKKGAGVFARDHSESSCRRLWIRMK